MRTSADPTDVETTSGRLVDLLCPLSEDIEVLDIATSLAFLNRYCGRAGLHYSVAQHSVLVADMLPAEDRIHGLLHDAPEYLVGDLSSPTKNALKSICPDFDRAWKWLEHAAERAIYARLNVPLPTEEQRARVKWADLVALATEARDIMQTPNAWNLPHPAAESSIVPVSAQVARDDYLNALESCGIDTCRLAAAA